MRSQSVAVAAVVILLTTACDDVPLIPRWDADFLLPIASQGFALGSAFPGGTIPVSPAGPVPISTGVETQGLDDAMGDLLDDELLGASLIFTVSSTIPLDGADTLFLAGSAAALTSPAAIRIVAPFTLVSATPSTTDTVVLGTPELDMLRFIASSNGTLYFQMRGSVTYTGPAPRPVTASDSIAVQVQCLCRIAVSR